MINPTPIHSRTSPYSSNSAGKGTAPRTIATPLQSARQTRIKRSVAYVVLVLIAAVTTYAFAQYSSFVDSISVQHEGDESSILANNGKADATSLKQAGDGRFNLLLLGVGGEGHSGAYLTDTIKVLSLDPTNKTLSVTSVPRDLYVSIPGSGKAKINAAYTYGEQDHKGGGGALAKQVVGQVLDTKVSNFVMVDFSAAKQLVDALGGVDVTVPRAIDDPFFPADVGNGYKPFSISAGRHHMNGATALAYSRSRETTSDFDRAERQTLVLKALKEKALSLGVLSNPVKVSNLISILGNHVKTDLPTNDILTFISLVKDIPSDKIISHVLSTDPDLGLLTSTTDPTAGYISYPVLGIGNFSAVQQWYQKHSPDPFLAAEAPTVTVVGTGSATQKQLFGLVQALNDYGFQAVLGADTANRSQYRATAVFDGTRKKKVSRNYLGSYFDATVQSGSPLEASTDFTVIYVPGSAATASPAALK